MEKKVLISILLLLGASLFIGTQTPTGLFLAPLADISSCTNITESSNLTTNITSASNCLNITASNVLLDCQGFTITWDSGGTGSDAIVAGNVTNITIQNCIITDINESGATGQGINLTNVTNSSIINNTIQTNGTSSNIGIQVNANSTNITITNSTIQTNGSGGTSQGISTSTSSLITITNNIIRTGHGSNANSGIVLSATNHTYIANNQINTSGTGNNQRGIQFITSGTNHTVHNNTIYTSSGAAVNSNSPGIQLASVTSTTINYNRINANGASNRNHGIWFVGSNSNTIVSNNTITTNGTSANRGIEDIPSNVFLINNTIITNGNGSRATTIQGTNITFTDTTITTLIPDTDAYAFLADPGGAAQVYNSTLNDTGSWINIITTATVNFTNTTFLTSFGSIQIPQNVTINGTNTVTKAKLNITQNEAFLNSTNLTFLNTSARITLNNIGNNPGPTVDLLDNDTFVTCPQSVCTKISYDGSTFIYDVTHFTTYSSQNIPLPSGGSGGQYSPITEIQAPTQTITITQETQKIKLKRKEIAQFSVNNQQHTLTVLSVSTYSVNVRVQSTPKDYVLIEQEPLTIDLDKDGTDDIRLTLIEIVADQAEIQTEILTQPRKTNTSTPQIEKPTETKKEPLIQNRETTITQPTQTHQYIETPVLIQPTINTQKQTDNTKPLTYLFYIIAITAIAVIWIYTHYNHLRHIK